MKVKWNLIVLAGVAVGMVGNLWGLLTCRWLFKWVYLACSPELYRSEMLEGTFGWMLCMGASKILLGILMVLAYAVIGSQFPGRMPAKGVLFGGLLWLLGLLSSKWSMFMSLTIPPGTFLYWIVNDLVSSVLLGMLTVVLYERAGVWWRVFRPGRAFDLEPRSETAAAAEENPVAG